MFERTISAHLEAWRRKAGRKPLVLRGARQVGKTTALRAFAGGFDHAVFLNMEEPKHRALFHESLSFEERISAALLSGSVPRHAESTLVFLDEIQACPQAVATLRYFHETAPHIGVVAAGSLMEAAIDVRASFPVGRVEYLVMHPCTFREFLGALGETELSGLLDRVPFPRFAHEKARGLFKLYMLVGGMPEAVALYASTRDLVAVNGVYESLLTSFLDDVEKYAKNSFVRVVRHLIRTAFAEAGKRVRFQGFGKSAYSSKDVHEAFDLLEKAMLVRLVYPTSSVAMPVLGDRKKSPKLQLLDGGILHYQSGLQKELFVAENPESVAYGTLVEHAVGLMLCATFTNPSAALHFWAREKKQSNAEVDFVFPFQSMVVPVEVKSGATGRLRSLHEFVDRAPHPFAVRFCDAPVSVEGARTVAGKAFNLLNLPWYLAGEIGPCLGWLVAGGREFNNSTSPLRNS